jgi:UDP-GlcNAc:undecaprenyl-phosphate GlcNAc-1-phosphate transferase
VIWWGFVAAILSALFSLWFRKLALAKQIALAVPRERDIHMGATPRVGGMAIVASFVLVMICVAIFAPKSSSDLGFPYAIWGISIDKRLLGILLSVVVLSAVMVVDDIKGVKAYFKLFFQIVAAGILIVAGVGFVYLNNPLGNTIYLDSLKYPFYIGGQTYHLVVWADLFFLVWVLLLTNATNFIDGLDGLAGTLSLIAGVILALLSLSVGQYSTALLCVVFCGAIAGFLPFNWPKAKIFLGDTGSMFLGLMLATITIITGGKLGTVLLVFGLVILDALYVIAKRLYRGQNPLTTPDQSHIHHRFLVAGFSRKQTLIIISAISLGFGLCGVYLHGITKLYLILALAVLSILLFIFLDIKARQNRKNNLNLSHGN